MSADYTVRQLQRVPVEVVLRFCGTWCSASRSVAVFNPLIWRLSPATCGWSPPPAHRHGRLWCTRMARPEAPHRCSSTAGRSRDLVSCRTGSGRGERAPRAVGTGPADCLGEPGLQAGRWLGSDGRGVSGRPAVATGSGMVAGAGRQTRKLLPPCDVGCDALHGRQRRQVVQSACGLPAVPASARLHPTWQATGLLGEFHDRLREGEGRPRCGPAGRVHGLAVRAGSWPSRRPR